VTSFSHFKGTKLTLDRLAAVLDYYVSDRHTHATRVYDVSSQCKVGDKAAGRVLGVLRQLEAEAGMRQSQALLLEGDLEGDAHGLRQCWVSTKNKKFEKEVNAAKRCHPGKRPKVWKLHVRVAGLCQRDGLLALEPVQHKLVLPGGAPPPEDTEEVRATGLLKQAKPRASVVVFADGAPAWKEVVTKDFPHLFFPDQVVHSRHEFVKEVATPAGHSSLAGTESIDQRWKRLDAYLPPEKHTKKDHEVDPSLWTYVYSWLWRHNLRGASLATALGDVLASVPVES